MHFFTSEPIQNSITRALKEDPNVPPEKILLDSDLSTSIRYEIPTLVDYLTRPDTLQKLSMYALTRENENVENYEKVVRASVLVLSSVSKSLQEKLQDDETFIKALQMAQKSNLEKDLLLCGHFQRIVEAFVRYTNGGFLQHFPGLCEFLIKNIHVLALKELLLRLMTDFSEAYPEDQYENIAYDLACASSADNGYFVVTVMRDIMKEKKSTITMFQNERVVKALLNTSINPPPALKYPLFEAEIFKVIEKIAKDCVITDHIIAEYSKKFTFDPNNITCGTVSALRIFKDGINVLLPRFFIQPYITILNQLIFERIQDMFDRQLASVIEKFNIPQKIMETFDTHLVNGHITELALYIQKKTNISKALQTEEWTKFVEEKLKPRDAERIVKPLEDDVPACCQPQVGFIPSGKKSGLAPTASFGGFSGGIGTLVKLAQADVDKKKDSVSEAPAAAAGFTPSLAGLMGGGGGGLGGLMGGGGSGSGGVGGGLSGGINSSMLGNLKPGISSGHSFTIPTVYQADPIQNAMVC